MPSKRKPKPSYNVPEDLQETPQSGWVYRSGSPDPEDMPQTAAVASKGEPGPSEAGEAAPPAVPPPAAKPSGNGSAKSSESKSITSQIVELTARTVSSSAAAVGNALLLGARLVTAPISIGMKMLGLRK